MSFRFRFLSLAALTVATLLAARAAPAADLLSMQLEELMDIGVVGASKYVQPQAEVAAAVSVITRQEIRAHGWRTLGEALQSLPGFTTTYDRQYVYPTLRGIGLPGDYATRVLVTIDGNRANDPLYDQGPFGRMLPIDLDLVERIEFIPGPGSAVYGQNAMFGVVNLVTRKGDEVSGFEASASGREPQREREGRLTWSGRVAADTRVLLSASALGADGENRFYDFGSAGVSGVATGLDWERVRQLFARIDRGPWALDAFYGARIKGDPTASFLTDPLAPGKANRDEYAQSQLVFQKPYDDGRLDVFARVFFGQYVSDAKAMSSGQPFEVTGTARWYGGEARIVSRAMERHTVMVGAEGQIETTRNQSILDLMAPANDLLLHSSGHRLGLYGQDEWQMGPSIATTLGVRIDGNDSTGTQASPRVGVLWHASSALALKALYGRAQRAPNGFERDYADGFARTSNPDLRGEKVDTTELVADLRAAPDFALRASLYHWALMHIVTLGTDPATGLAQYQSGLPIDANGVELSADHTWARGARLRASLSLQDTIARADGQRLPNSPAWLGKVSLLQPLPWRGWQVAMLWRYDGSRLDLVGHPLGGWGVADVTVTAQDVAPGVDLTLAVMNLSDRRYSLPASNTNWQDSLEQDGRSIRLSIGYRF